MKKFIAVLILCLSISSAGANELVDPDPEIHKVVGGLYSLAAAVELNSDTNPTASQFRNLFANIPGDWLKNVKISKAEDSIWVGVPIGRQSTARHFLRSKAPDLGITEEPEGYAWIGGDYAWLKAADIAKKSLEPVEFIATKSDGVLFFSTQGQEAWWQAYPDFNSKSESSILKKHEAKDAPELHKPAGVSRSIYESVKPSSVQKVPEEMHVGTKKSSFDMSVEVGDVIFNPIPNVKR